MTVAAPAKVNLWLRVGPREETGFHRVDTLFCALDLADTVVLRRKRSGDPLLDRGFAPPLEAIPELGPDSDNLAVRAARSFLDRIGAGESEMPAIRLVKRIPAAGGLGGGSSDAAAVLRGMSRLHPRALDTDGLLALGEELGSDVPFFVLGGALAHGAGRGERLRPMNPLPPRTVVLVLPPYGVSTAAAFRWLDESRAGVAGLPDSEGAETWEAVEARAVNDFETVVFERHPHLRVLRDVLREHGAGLSLLAGSGSTVFGVFEDRAGAEAAAAAVRNGHPDCRVVLTATRAR